MKSVYTVGQTTKENIFQVAQKKKKKLGSQLQRFFPETPTTIPPVTRAEFARMGETSPSLHRGGIVRSWVKTLNPCDTSLT